jgi:Aspartokinases
MKVLKFGGTSLGSAQRIKNVASVIADQAQRIVVLSPMAGTTNSLVETSECFHQRDPE